MYFVVKHDGKDYVANVDRRVNLCRMFGDGWWHEGRNFRNVKGDVLTTKGVTKKKVASQLADPLPRRGDDVEVKLSKAWRQFLWLETA